MQKELILGINLIEIVTIIHLLGVVIGAGAAFFSDFLFNSHMKDKMINTDETKSLRLASTTVWVGFAMIIISGLLLFVDKSDELLHSSKFLAKMTIVGIAYFNGLMFHISGIPLIEKFTNKKLIGNEEFYGRSKNLFIGGAISATSWMSALVLGSLRGIEASYLTIMIIYFVVVALAVAASLYIHRNYLRTHQ